MLTEEHRIAKRKAYAANPEKYRNRQRAYSIANKKMGISI